MSNSDIPTFTKSGEGDQTFLQLLPSGHVMVKDGRSLDQYVNDPRLVERRREELSRRAVTSPMPMVVCRYENYRAAFDPVPVGPKTFTVDEIEAYLQGWLFDPPIQEAWVAIANGLSQLRCDQDGIEARTERVKAAHRRDVSISAYRRMISRLIVAVERANDNPWHEDTVEYSDLRRWAQDEADAGRRLLTEGETDDRA